MSAPSIEAFEQLVMPHLPAAYNLARWILHDAYAADDAVQEAFVRALRFFKDLRQNDARPWLLGIVRNSCYDWLRQHRQHQLFEPVDDTPEHELVDQRPNPERAWEQLCQASELNQALQMLPPAYREVIVLRELENLSYESIAQITGVPGGTVMSRLSRGRQQLRKLLTDMQTAGTPGSAVRQGASHEI